ncbi:MAG: hypothetical protein K2Q18_16765 [Bdellovibrionales bacterium]|nr:hypothetical protein [Bdellovibrionales bacterium]
MIFNYKNMIRFINLGLIISNIIFFSGCKKSSTDLNGNSALVTKGSREIGMDILDTTPSSTFSNNIALAKAAGASYMILGLGWNQIETSTPSDCTTAGTYVDPGNALTTFNSLLPASGLKLSLSILPISTNINLMPSNLASSNFDDALVVCRYQKMLNFVFSKIPNVELVSIQFGNEIDAYPSANQSSFWSQYWSFFVQAQAAAKTLRSGVKASVVSTLYGATGLSTNPLAQGGLQQIYNNADVVVVTYYPLNTNFTVKNPSVVDNEMTSIVSLYPSKPIYFNEIGYPSGLTYNGSSEALQKQFVTQVFKTWDKFSTQISKISFLRLNNVSHTSAQDTADDYGMSGNNEFIEFIETLGLRTYGGLDKPAFTQLKTETQIRGW